MHHTAVSQSLLSVNDYTQDLSLNSMGPTPKRLSCNFVNVYRVQYTFRRVHAHIPNGQPSEEKRAARVSVESADKSARIVVRDRLVAS